MSVKNKCLGKLKPKFDKRTLQFSKYFSTAILPYAPQTSHWPNAAPLGMLMNDTIGDCAIAGPLHMERIWSKANNIDYTPTDTEALAAYSAVSGYVPGDDSTDTGCVLLDVLKYWKNTGIGGRKIGAFVQVDPSNHMHVEHASFFFGGLLVGVNLPVSAQTQELVWDVPPTGLSGSGAPGSWGGHCFSSPGYTQKTLDTITWGERISQTWKFWDAYVDECYAILSLDFILNSNLAPNGFDLISLQQDMKLITS